jgi:hypothetical protein
MRRFDMRRLAAAAALGASLALIGASTGYAGDLPTTVNGKHVMWGQGQGYGGSSAQTNQDQLIFHGGLVETTPKVYLVYWGTEWQTGFSMKDASGAFTYTNASAENYVNSFFSSLGGTPWAAVQDQYCQNVPAGTVDCSQYPYAQHITNPKGQLKGVWVDSSPVPAEIVTTGLAENLVEDPIATEATKAADHFGYDINATYLIFTPPGHGATAYGSVYCGYHTETTVPGAHGVRYAFIPFVPEQGAGCGQNSVNATDDKFGHGFFDGFSIVAGHEYAEAVTDPDNLVVQDGWNDASTSENGDKCAWTGLQNVSMNGKLFAVQPMWSNTANGGAGGCAVSP